MEESEQPAWGKKLSKFVPFHQRHILAFMGLMGIMNAYTMRNCLTVTLTQLVKMRNYSKTEIEQEHYCPKEEVDLVQIVKHGQYDWDQELQGNILGAFYIGYIISHVPGGILADILGGKWILGIGILSTALFTLVTPFCIEEGGALALIVLRVLMGLGEGTTFPALGTLMARWVPLKERGLLGSIVLSGGILGQILGQMIAGVILEKSEWQDVFFFFGFLGVLWFIFYVIMCFNDPYSHPYIKESEKEYLLAEMGSLRREEQKQIPWTPMAKSKAVYALAIAQIGHDWGFYVMAVDLPKYMNDVLQVTIRRNGIFSSLPFIAMWVSAIGSGFIGDLLIKKEWMTITKVRKFMTGLAAFAPAVFMVAAAYAGCNKSVVFALFTIAMLLMGPYYCGIKLTPLDMSPNYSGILMSFSNGVGSITGFVVPWCIGLMTPNTSMGEWLLVFWLALVILSLSAVAFVIWGTGDVQEWDNPKDDDA